ncbi:MAG TPA: CARDB domain-containing protein, partial [Candidatus Thermoplasmatota archaeon]|nr:CARDB domain-containing protein [Candidatus Thermoplasmatota archaeon]
RNVTVSGRAADDASATLPMALNATSGRWEADLLAPRDAGLHAYAFTARDLAGSATTVLLEVDVTSGPDPAVLAGDLTAPAPLVTGGPGALAARVRNLGGLDAPGTTVTLRLGAATLATATVDVPALGAVDLTLPFSTVGLYGNRTFDLMVAAGPGVYDANLTNGATGATLLVDAADLAPTALRFDAENVTSGLPLGVTVHVTNPRPIPASGVRVDLRVDGLTDTGTVATTLVDVPGNATVSVPLVWNTAGFAGNHTVRAFVDPNAVVPDLDRTNNVLAAIYAVARFVPEQPPETLRFVPVPVASASAPLARGVAAAELTGDARVDFAVSDGSGWVVVYENAGTRELPDGRGVTVDFAPALVASFGQPAYGLASADVARDGRADLVVGLRDGRVVLLPDAEGVGQRTLFDVGDEAYGLTAGDYDRDGDLDLAAANALGHVSTYLNDGTGAFAFDRILTTRAEPFGLTSGDYDLNGHLDLIVGDRLGQLDRLENAGTGFASVFFADVGSYAHGLATGDFDLNGRLDFVALGLEGRVSLYYQRAGAFVINPLLVAQAPQSLGLGAGDFNGDGRMDVAVASEDGGVEVLLNSVALAKTLSLSPVATTSAFDVTTVVENPYARMLRDLNLTERYAPGYEHARKCVQLFVCHPYDVALTGPSGTDTVYVLFPGTAFRASGSYSAVPWTGNGSFTADGWTLTDALGLLGLRELAQREEIRYAYALRSVDNGTAPVSTRVDFTLEGPPGTAPLDALLGDDVSNVRADSANAVNPDPSRGKRDFGWIDQTAIPGDLEVTGLVQLPQDPHAGIRMRATVRNNAPVPLTDVTMRILPDGTMVEGDMEEVWTGQTFAPGQTRDYEWRFLPRVAGSVLVQAEVNFDRRTIESDYANNRRDLAVDAPDVDLRVVEFRVDPATGTEGGFADVVLVVENVGAAASGPFDVHVSTEGSGHAQRFIVDRADARCSVTPDAPPECLFLSGGTLLSIHHHVFHQTAPLGPGETRTLTHRAWFADESLHSEGTRLLAAAVHHALPYVWDARPGDNGANATVVLGPSPPDLIRDHFGFQALNSSGLYGVDVSNPVGDVIQLAFRERNSGGTDAGAHAMDLIVDGALVERSYLGPLAQHQTRAIATQFDWAAFGPGDKNVTFVLDPEGNVSESREHNNASTVTVRWKEPRATSLQLSTLTPAPLDVVQATAGVANDGDLRTGPFVVALYVDGVRVAQTNVSLAARAATTVVFPFVVPASGVQHRVVVVVDDTDVVPAENVPNNQQALAFTTAGWEFHLLATGEEEPTLSRHAWDAVSGWQADGALDVAGLPLAPEPRLADPDGDGDLDLLVGALDGTLRWLRKDPAGYAPAPWTMPAFDAGFRSVAGLGDLDGDGDLDLVAGTIGADWAVAFRGGGAPAWGGIVRGGAGLAQVPHVFGDAPLLADLTGDGRAEFVVGHADGTLGVWENAGTYAAPAWTARAWLAGVALPGAAVPAAGDVDGDGDADLVVGAGDGTVVTLLSSGGPAPSFSEHSRFTADPRAAPALADLDADGRADLVLGTQPEADRRLQQGYAYEVPWKVVNHDAAPVDFFATRLQWVDAEGEKVADAAASAGFTVQSLASQTGTFLLRVPREIPPDTRLEGSVDTRYVQSGAWQPRPDLGGFAFELKMREGRRYEVQGSHALFDGASLTPVRACGDYCPVRAAPGSGAITLVSDAQRQVVRYDRQSERPLAVVPPVAPPIELAVAQLGDGGGTGLKPGYVEHVRLDVLNRNRIPYRADRVAIEVRDGSQVYDLFTDTTGRTLPPGASNLSYELYVPEGVPVGATVRVAIVERAGLPDDAYARSSERTWDADPLYQDQSAWGLQRIGETSTTTLRRDHWLDSTVERAETLAFESCGSMNVSVNRLHQFTLSGGCGGTARYGWAPILGAFRPGANEISINATICCRSLQVIFYDTLAQQSFAGGVVQPAQPAWTMSVGDYGARAAGFLRREYPETVNVTVDNRDDDPFRVKVVTFSLVPPAGPVIPLETHVEERLFPGGANSSQTYAVTIPDGAPLGSKLRVRAERVVGFPDSLWSRHDETTAATLLDLATNDTAWGDSVPRTDAEGVRKTFFAPQNLTRAELILGGDARTNVYLNANFQGATYAGWSPISANGGLRPAAPNALAAIDGSFSAIRTTEAALYVGNTFEGGAVVQPEEPPFYAVFGLREGVANASRAPFQVYPGEAAGARVVVTNLLPEDRSVDLSAYAADLATARRAPLSAQTVLVPGGSSVYVEMPANVPPDAGTDLRLQLSARWNETVEDKAWLRASNLNDAAASNPLLDDSGWGVTDLGSASERARYYRKHLWLDDRTEDVWIRTSGANALWVNGVSVPVTSGLSRLAHNEANKGQDNVFALRSDGLDADADLVLTRFLPVRTTDLAFDEDLPRAVLRVEAGEPVPLGFTVVNGGDLFARQHEMVVSLAGATVARENLTSHPFSEDAWSYALDATGLAGRVDAVVRLDAADVVVETAESNNVLVVPFFVDTTPVAAPVLETVRAPALGANATVRFDARDADGEALTAVAEVLPPGGSWTTVPATLAPDGLWDVAVPIDAAGVWSVRFTATDPAGHAAV